MKNKKPSTIKSTLSLFFSEGHKVHKETRDKLRQEAKEKHAHLEGSAWDYADELV